MLPSPLVRNKTNLILEDLFRFFFQTETAPTNFSFPFRRIITHEISHINTAVFFATIPFPSQTSSHKLFYFRLIKRPIKHVEAISLTSTCCQFIVVVLQSIASFKMTSRHCNTKDKLPNSCQRPRLGTKFGDHQNRI